MSTVKVIAGLGSMVAVQLIWIVILLRLPGMDLIPIK